MKHIFKIIIGAEAIAQQLRVLAALEEASGSQDPRDWSIQLVGNSLSSQLNLFLLKENIVFRKYGNILQKNSVPEQTSELEKVAWIALGRLIVFFSILLRACCRANFRMSLWIKINVKVKWCWKALWYLNRTSSICSKIILI